MPEKNGNSAVSNIVNAYAQAGLAGVLAIVLSLNMYFSHQLERDEIAADAINLKAINDSNARIATAMESMAQSAQEEVAERRKQVDNLTKQLELLRELLSELKRANCDGDLQPE